MEWFLIWNTIGLGIAAWKMSKDFLGNQEPTLADTLFAICMVPLWPILLYFILGDKQ